MEILVHGRRAYCHTGGKPFDPSLPTAVFVHGAQHDHSVWTLQTRYFAHHGFGVLAVDLPGHGRSEGPPLADIGSMARWLLALLDAAGAGLALAIGHSMGSLVALETGRLAPQRIAGIALVATAYPMRVSPALLDAAASAPTQAIDLVNGWSLSPPYRASRSNPGSSAHGVNRRLMQRIAAADPTVFATDFRACDAYADGEAAAAALRCPVLFVLGRDDRMTPPKASAALRERLPAAHTALIDGGAHGLMAEQPDAALDALYGWAAGIAPASGARP